MTSTLQNNLERHLPFGFIDRAGLGHQEADIIYRDQDIKFDFDANMFAEVASLLDSSPKDEATPHAMMEDHVIHLISDMADPLRNILLGGDQHTNEAQPTTIIEAHVSPSSSSCGSDLIEVATGIANIVVETIYDRNDLVSVSPSPSNSDIPDYIKSIEKIEQVKEVEKTGLIAKSSNPKKRRRSYASAEDIQGAVDDIDQEAKRERNRYHARRSRQRKQSITDSLKVSLEELKAENAKLREQIYAAIGQAKSDSLVEARLASPAKNFISAFKKPVNRVLDSKAVEFFQGLRKNI
jgi:hypothetical protein